MFSYLHVRCRPQQPSRMNLKLQNVNYRSVCATFPALLLHKLHRGSCFGPRALPVTRGMFRPDEAEVKETTG